MKLGEYLENPERVRTSTSAYAGEYADKSGTLACTDSSLVYIEQGNVTDISREMICAVEYEEKSIDTASLLAGIGGIALGLLGFGARDIIEDAEPMLNVVSPFFLLVGVVTIGAAIYYRRSSLDIHVPSKSFIFTSKKPDLGEIAKSLQS